MELGLYYQSKIHFMQKIVPFLWYKDDKAEEAANFYVSIIRGAKITEIMRAGKAGPGPVGSVITVSFTVGGQEIGYT